MDYCLDDLFGRHCHPMDWEGLLVDLLLLLLLVSCAEVSTAMDNWLDLELHWLLEVAVAVAVEVQYLFLSGLLDSVAVLECLFLMELLLVHRPHFAGMP